MRPYRCARSREGVASVTKLATLLPQRKGLIRTAASGRRMGEPRSVVRVSGNKNSPASVGIAPRNAKGNTFYRLRSREMSRNLLFP